MKKLIFPLIGMLTLSLASCNNDQTSNTTSSTTTTTTTTTNTTTTTTTTSQVDENSIKQAILESLNKDEIVFSGSLKILQKDSTGIVTANVTHQIDCLISSDHYFNKETGDLTYYVTSLYKDKDGETPLFKCTQNRDLLKYLVKTAHANVDAKDNNGRTIFLLACKNSLHLLLAPLYDLKADVHAVDNQKRNALHCAAEIKYVWGYLLDFLIEKCKININDVDENGQTPLIYTCSINPVWCGVNADLFVKYGADITIQDNQNKTAYYYARKCQNRDAIECTRIENKN